MSSDVFGSSTHIIDYGLGNIFSISRALEAIGSVPIIAETAQELAEADRIILPGVGAFPPAAATLRDTGFADALIQAANIGTPVLAICLGMQLLFDSSDEFGGEMGLGLFAGSVRPVVDGEGPQSLRSTHIARRPLCWSENANSSLIEAAPPSERFYFVHSFSAEPSNKEDIWASVYYGDRRVVAAVGRRNVWGFQFHPEKSGEAGLRLLNAFVRQGSGG